jgi:hypothetical protein
MPWFQEFAGLAFTWQDAAPRRLFGRSAPVFAVVPTEPEPAGEVIEFTLAGG